MNYWHRLLYSPFLAQLIVTRRCNLSCGYCNEYDLHSPPVDARLILERMRKLRDLGTLALEFTGGEPLLHPKIIDFVGSAQRMGFWQIMMISNAFLLNREKIKRLNGAGLQHLQISVDGVEPNETTNKVLKSLRRRLELLAEIANFKVTLSSVIGSANDSQTLEVLKFAKSLGFKPRVLLIHSEDGQLDLTSDQVKLFSQIQDEIGRSVTESADYRTRLLTEGRAPFRCRAGSRYIYVDEFGQVCWCSQTREEFSRPLDEYGASDLKEQFLTPKACSERCTIGCARTNSKLDEWRPQYLGFRTAHRRASQ
ncbi:MAG: radical SAM protein [Alphaproteobacteria bacterium]|nr:radical SAM protein [Alphaproteobacteria bacterium]